MKSDKTVFRLAAGNLSAAFRRTSGGLSLSELRDTSSGTRFFRGHSPLFFLTARMLPGREEILLRSDEGWSAANAAAAGSACLFTFENHRDVPGVTVLLEAVAERDRIRWTVRLHNARADLTLTECDYPILPFDASPARRVFYPYGCGEVYPSAEPFSIRHSYPSYGVSMQYMAFWDEKKKRGVYFGLHDSAPAFKRLQYEHRPEDPNPFLRASMPLKDVGIPENSQTLEGEAVWELFDGDWFDAASIYKSFALTNASWIPETNPETGYRKDVPDWLRRNPHWWRKRLRESDGFANELLDAAKDLGLSEPSPVHLYDWHQIPYDTNYPHYFPVKDCFITGTEQLHEGGMRFMPYVNGRLWDTHDRGSEDWQFTPVAKPFCVKDESGKPVTETYSTSGVPLAVMCPSAALWQEKQKEIAETLFRPYRADGLYIDQIGAAQPYPCEDRTHSHRPGGGTWWVESYRNLVDHVRRSIPEGGFLTTECTSEPYMKNIQGFLTWIWIRNRQVPAFPAVYNRLVVLFGRNYAAAPTASGQNMLVAQSLTYGEQMGWIYPEVYRNLKHRSFYRKCVLCREKIGSFFYDGEILRSPSIRNSRVLRTSRITIEAIGGRLSHAATFSEIWRRSDGKKLLILINASGKPDKPVITSPDLPDGVFAPFGDLKTPVACRNGECAPELPPLSVSYLIWE